MHVWARILLTTVVSLLPVAVLGGDPLVVCARIGPFFANQDGTMSGIEHDLLRGFADSRDMELEVIWASTFESVFELVEQELCDVGAARITKTEARAERVDFSTPYFPVLVVLVVRADSKISCASDLAGKTVAARGDTIYEEMLGRVEGAQVVIVAKDVEMFDAVIQGKADALACDSAVVLPHLGKHPDLKIAFALAEHQQYAFAVSKGSEIRAQLDGYLAETRRNGTYRKLLESYYGDLAELILDSER